jgi:hypothetical protein
MQSMGSACVGRSERDKKSSGDRATPNGQNTFSHHPNFICLPKMLRYLANRAVLYPKHKTHLTLTCTDYDRDPLSCPLTASGGGTIDRPSHSPPFSLYFIMKTRHLQYSYGTLWPYFFRRLTYFARSFVSWTCEMNPSHLHKLNPFPSLMNCTSSSIRVGSTPSGNCYHCHNRYEDGSQRSQPQWLLPRACHVGSTRVRSGSSDI